MICLGKGRFFGETVSAERFGRIVITASRYRAGDSLPRHCHEQAYLYVMLAGGIAERAMHRENVCTRGWLIYNEAGEAHEDRVFEQGAVGLNIEMPLDWLRDVQTTCSVGEPLLYRHAGAAITSVGALQLAMRQRDSLQALGVEEAVVRLVDSLSARTHGRHSRPAWLQKAEDEIGQRYRTGLRLDDIADAIGVHRAHLCREFRRHCGCTMTQYAGRLRADLALEALIRSAEPLATLAARTGYADQAHLTRAIRRHFGTTPGILRRAHGGR
jgi:AraC family transcriptional regulator